jgi:hypothetical protein
MFAEILDKLETIEERIDSLEASLTEAGSVQVTLTGEPAGQLDSLLAVTSWIARDIVGESLGGWEICGAFDAGFEVELKFASAAEGKASVDLGAWAGTGAFAGGTVKAAGNLEGGVAGQGKAGIEYCNPFGTKALPDEARPASPLASGPARSPELDQLEASLTTLTTQLNLTPATLAQALGGVGSAFSGTGSLDLQNVGDYLPLPSGLAAVADDPMGAALSRVQGLSSSAQSALCSGSGWGSNVSAIVSESCDVIDGGGLANITAFADIASSYPVVQNAVTTVCTRVNSIGLQRLVIPSWDVTILGSTYEVFPGYNQRLFPSYTTMTCP